MRRIPLSVAQTGIGLGSSSPSKRRCDDSKDGETPSDAGPPSGLFGGRTSCVCLVRAPIMPLLSVEKGPSILFRPFKSPLKGHQPGVSEESLRKTLGVRLKRSSAFAVASKQFKSPPPAPTSQALPEANPLVLYIPPPDRPHEKKVEVDPMLTRWLREHQRQGVKFMFDCLMGLKEFQGEGCILADDMGLGKTLQSITILWTLLEQNIEGTQPAVRRAVVVCPASLVNNWAAEIQKWLQGRCGCTPVADNCKEKVVSKFEGFKYDRQSRILIASYETFRMHVHRLEGVPIDMVVCDEAHRLKNDKTKTSLAIIELPAKKRLLLSGTPIQNDLDEFFALVSLCNPNVVGDAHTFRRRYANPILVGREPDATEDQQQLAAERLTELSSLTNLFILRRTNSLLAKVLPPKVVLNVFCRLTPLQKEFYRSFLSSKSCRKMFTAEAEGKGGFTGRVLSSIQGLMKLCNHPSLVKSQAQMLQGFEKCEKYFSELDLEGQKARSRMVRTEISGKLLLLARLLDVIRTTTNDKIVLISNYTQTLDLFDRMCRDCGYPVMRLDGQTSIKKRHAMITKFNDPMNPHSFVFLLSSKAGGCGVNLIGANRLVLFDPDWNPANDKQALARVWRDGQKKSCYIYRFFSTGTIEEKIYQRQICKDGLSAMLVSDGENQIKDSLSTELVKDLFRLREDTLSDTHDMLECRRCGCRAAGQDVENEGENERREAKRETEEEMLGSVPQLDEDFDEDDLVTWAHHRDLASVPDPCLRQAALACVDPLACDREDEEMISSEQPISFVMSCRIEFKDEGKPQSPAAAAPVCGKSSAEASPCGETLSARAPASPVALSEGLSKKRKLADSEEDEEFVVCVDETSSEEE
ncbi:SWI2/SNF2-containing protein RAD54 [Toxoplasma gondii GT1]|uniref:SWI2/SNF2-containing protein RAD54 n=7 Tax=Toxoplasma gondii TaxID=5811 RepID=S7V3M5_TOXGG|nr:SWI2/SNF2-containing protein RAD54 [Toxoplasma gondii GT1]KAF4641844.1 SWI2/SNF2-containing protein RAD54 [Toxoplasma gondii]